MFLKIVISLGFFIVGANHFGVCAEFNVGDTRLGPERPIITPDDQFKVSPADTTKKDHSLDGLAEMLDAEPSFGGVFPDEGPFDDSLATKEPKANLFESV